MEYIEERKEMKKRILFELTIGLLMLVSALYTYIPEPEYMHELTFISNMAGAVIFLADGLYRMIRHKQLPKELYFIEAVTIGIVFLVSVGCTASGMAHFNFSGGMVFLHVINPILVIGFYLFEKGEREDRIKTVAVTPLFVIAYLLFDYIRFLLVGSFVYGLFPTEGMSVWKAIMIGIVTYIVVALWGLVLYAVRRMIGRLKNCLC